MRRGSFSMRVRRRQSDAKWRASVATCYETLKHVIPDCDKISKRKISKALILQETEKHIKNLENVLKDILSDKARSRGKVVLYQTNQGLVEANLSDVQKDFSTKQQAVYIQNFGQRKRSNIPSDIESGLINLRSSLCPLTVLPAECLQQQVVPSTPDLVSLTSQNKHTNGNKDHEYLAHFLPIIKPTVKDYNMQIPFEDSSQKPQNMSLLQTPVKTRPKRKKCSSTCVKEDYEYYSPGEITPYKKSHGEYLQSTPKSGHKHQHINRTPLRILTELQLEKNSGFTPVKLPTDDCTTRHQTGFTPIKLPMEYGSPSDLSGIPPGFTPIKLPTESVLPESPFTTICMKSLSPSSKERLDKEYAWSEHLGLTSLLCDESIDNMELGDEEDLAKKNSRTPQNIMKPKEERKKGDKGKKFRSATASSENSGPTSNPIGRKTEAKCRRQLEKCFETEKENLPVINGVFDNADTSCLDFDGYFLFYQYVAGDKISDKGEIARQVSQMWREMPEDTRDTFIAMAALEGSQSDSSNLSDDLKELDVKPIEKYDILPMSAQRKNMSSSQVTLPIVQLSRILIPSNTERNPYLLFLPDNKEQKGIQEVPMDRVILHNTSEQILVPEISELVTVSDTSEAAVVPEMCDVSTNSDVTQPGVQFDQVIGQNVEVYSDHGDFHVVPEKDFIMFHTDRARADDLGFISLSNENSMSEEFHHQFSSQVTVDDLTEWKGQIVPVYDFD